MSFDRNIRRIFRHENVNVYGIWPVGHMDRYRLQQTVT
jgi:hypothetical protein